MSRSGPVPGSVTPVFVEGVATPRDAAQIRPSSNRRLRSPLARRRSEPPADGVVGLRGVFLR